MLEAPEGGATNALMPGSGTVALHDSTSGKLPPSADIQTTLMRRPGSSLRTITEYLRAADSGTGSLTVRLAEQAGFRCAFMNVGGGFGPKINRSKIDRFALPRVHVTADMSLFEFEAHISGFYRSLRKRLLGGDELEALVGA